MCRFLMVRAAKPVSPRDWLEPFAAMVEATPAPDGSPQADGWGVAWLTDGGGWELRKSLRPIWEEAAVFVTLPDARAFCVHARNASLPGQEGRLDFNQPYADDGWAFVFNGFLAGVTPPAALPGTIGAQKIWSLLRGLVRTFGALDGLAELDAILSVRSRRISALNIGLTDGARLYALSRCPDDEPYYRLYGSSGPDEAVVCSGPLAGRALLPLPAHPPIVL